MLLCAGNGKQAAFLIKAVQELVGGQHRGQGTEAVNFLQESCTALLQVGGEAVRPAGTLGQCSTGEPP